ncbi:MAG: adenylate/guanylate cyclase domain-containing protein [Deltaproteobacteria bacterium]|nr:adenylate/guanylate cyclase domain-containing protein [Deltaproteobacteria bacterium]
MPAIAKQDIRFCKTVDGVTIAYSTMGQGLPAVFPPQFVTHLEADLVEGPFAEVFEALAQHCMLVRFDKRGTGLSDRDVPDLSSDESFVPDLEAVVDAIRLPKFALYGLSAGGRLALHYYVKHPDRVSHLVFYGTNPQGFKGYDDERAKQRLVALTVIRASWDFGSKLWAERMMPYGGTREDIERIAHWLRVSATADVAGKQIELGSKRSDLRHLLDTVSVPTLVIHRRGDQVPFAAGRELASKIPGARFLPLEGNNHLPATHEEAMELVTPVVEFLALTGDHRQARSADEIPPVTLMFTDIEGSTSLTQRLGDEGAQRLLREHNEAVRRALDSYNGKEIEHTGDGIMASFFSASRAVGCAVQIQQTFAARNTANPEDAVRIRIGLNAGEPIAEGNDLFGASVQLARRICDRAEPSQVLVSDVVRQLVSGKGFTFEHIGPEVLKGFAEPVALYRVRVG